MRKIILTNYNIETIDDAGETIDQPYNVPSSIEGILLASGPVTNQRLGMVQLLRNHEIAEKIKSANDGFILLEEQEYQIVEECFSAFRNFRVFDVELCKRIRDAEEVEVAEIQSDKL